MTTAPATTYRWPGTRATLPKPAFAWDFAQGVLTPSRGSGTFVCTRASNKWVRGSDGLLSLIGNNAAPFNYSSVDGVRRLLVEEAATQLLVAASSRDLTQAAWVKVNGTAAKDKTGADGAANAASSFTATAGNATCLQTVVSAATNRIFAFRVKRLSGTGTVQFSDDNFLTNTDITASLSTTEFTRFTHLASILNPVVGFKLVTSGDSIAVDFVNLVASTCPTSDLDSTVSSRAADVVLLNPFTMPSPATIVVRGMMQAIDGTLDGTARFMFTISDGTANEVYRVQRTASSQTVSPVIVDGGASQLSGIGRAIGANVRVASVTAIATNDVAGAINALATQTDTSVTLPTVNRIHIGSNHAASGSWWNAGIEYLAIYSTRLPDSLLPQLCFASV